MKIELVDMTNEELAEKLMSRVPLDSNRHDDLREAAARLRRPTAVDDDLLKMARDIDTLRAKLKVAEDALKNLLEIVGDVSEYIEVDCGTMNKVEDAKDALAAIRGEKKGAGNGK